MMWNYGGGGWSWLWMTLMMLVFLGALMAVAVWGIRSGLGSPRQSDPMAILRRLAAGELSQEDFEKTKRILQG